MLDACLAGESALPKLKRWDVFHALAKLRCVIGVVQDVEDITRNEQFRARGFFVETEIDGRRVRAGGAPAKLMPSSWKLYRPAPNQCETTPRPAWAGPRYEAAPATRSYAREPGGGPRSPAFAC